VERDSQQMFAAMMIRWSDEWMAAMLIRRRAEWMAAMLIVRCSSEMCEEMYIEELSKGWRRVKWLNRIKT